MGTFHHRGTHRRRRDPGGEHRTIYDAIVDRAYKNLCEDEKAKEWEILRVTEPKAKH